MSGTINQPFEVLNSLAEVYDSSILEYENNRYKKLHDKFVEVNKVEPKFYIRAPGRVNLIGEHIDYHGYGVLPIAIANDIVMAVYGDDTPTTEDSSYEQGNFSADPTQTIEGHSWIKYFQCGYKGVFDNKPFPQTKLIAMVDGNVARAGGLSSSSAFVVASALATAHSHGISFTRKELAELCRKAEFYIGTMGGGMDQSISCFGLTNCALNITFQPLDAKIVTLPPGGAFVVSNTFVSAEKAVGANQHFNKRVVEGIFAAKVLGKILNIPNYLQLNRLKDLQEAFTPALSLETMIEKCKEHLHDAPYTSDELKNILGVELTQKILFPTRPAAQGVLDNNKEYYLKIRAIHVYSEAKRVDDFVAICEKPDFPGKLVEIGTLMNDSHYSCDKLYDCSCDELNELTQQERDSGAIGSRLTGAGWGGCSVSLIHEEETVSFLEKIKNGYMKKHNVSPEALQYGLFATKPCVGAAILSPKII